MFFFFILLELKLGIEENQNSSIPTIPTYF